MENDQFTKEDDKRGRKEQVNYKIARKKNKMALISLYLSIITLHVIGLNSPSKVIMQLKG